MPFRVKVSLVLLALLAALVLVVPLVVPVNPPDGVRPLAEVAGPGASYAEAEGVALHYVWTPAARAGEVPTFVMLHGFAYSAESFEEIAPLLAPYGNVVAFDRPAFGLTERLRPAEYENTLDPYAAASQPVLTLGLMDALGIASAVLVGHGDGARVALEVALSAPERVTGLVLIGAAPYVETGRSGLARLLMRTPQMQRVGPLTLRQLAGEPGLRIIRAAWADPSAIDQDTIRDYTLPLTVEGWDDALWQLSLAESPPPLAGRLAGVAAPALLLAGAGDRVVPTEQSERLALDLVDSELVVLPECGHVLHEECPEEALAAISEWVLRQDR